MDTRASAQYDVLCGERDTKAELNLIRGHSERAIPVHDDRRSIGKSQ
jgi:hypothetical protein